MAGLWATDPEKWRELVARCDEIRARGMSDEVFERLTKKMGLIVSRHPDGIVPYSPEAQRAYRASEAIEQYRKRLEAQRVYNKTIWNPANPRR